MKDKMLTDTGILILRVGISGFMLPHGIAKLSKLLAGGEITFADPIGLGATASLLLAVFSEFLCSLLLILGYKTRLAAIPLIITMAVAAFIVHSGDPWNKMEFALIYMLVYIVIAIIGPGKYSLDNYFTNKIK